MRIDINSLNILLKRMRRYGGTPPFELHMTKETFKENEDLFECDNFYADFTIVVKEQ